jgi:hypothetical protein
LGGREYLFYARYACHDLTRAVFAQKPHSLVLRDTLNRFCIAVVEDLAPDRFVDDHELEDADSSAIARIAARIATMVVKEG